MIRLFKHYFSLRRAVFFLGEGLLIFCAVALASLLVLGRGSGKAELFEIIWWKVLLVTVVTQISLYLNALYEFETGEDLIDLATRLIQSVGMAAIILAVIYFCWAEAIIGRWIFFFSIIFLLFFLASWRLLYALSIKKRLFTEKAIILGSGDLSGDIFREIGKRRDISYDIRSIVTNEDKIEVSKDFDGVHVQYGFDNLCDFAESNEVSSIIVALDQKRGIMPYNELLACKTRGITIIDGESFYERISGKLLVEKINPSWLIFSDGFVKSRISRLLRRLVSLVLSLVMFIVFSPLMLLTALLVKLDSTGPVFFSQQRVGEHERVFTLHKFRSMRADAEEDSGPVWATEDDPRITRVGRVIRKLRIDELPQLWNVLKGDMSFVGPRPERPFFVENLKRIVPYYRERFTAKPGVTGWAQIKYPYGASEEDALEKLKYDLYYIKNMSLVMDLIVIFHTVKIVLLGRGSR